MTFTIDYKVISEKPFLLSIYTPYVIIMLNMNIIHKNKEEFALRAVRQILAILTLT